MNLQSKTLNVASKIIFFVFLINISIYASSDGLTKVTAVNAPKLILEDIDEEEINLKDFKGKVVLVNFWATWCPPCRAEMSSLQSLYTLTKDKGVEVITVNVAEDADTVFSFLSNLPNEATFKAVIDKDSNAMKDWKVMGLPSTFIVNKEGKIVYKAIGGRDFNSKNIINKVIALTKEK